MKIYTYASDNIKYLCHNVSLEAEEADTTWDVWKFSDADLPTREGPRTGAINTSGVVDAYSWKT
jgi:hypothetical protein